MNHRWLLAALAVLACGCSADSDSKTSPPEKQGQVDEWKTLLTGDWSVPAGVEDYACVRYTLPEDVFIRGVQAINPLGTHHTLLTIGEPNETDGIAPCNVAENHTVPIFGSGVGTNPVEFPEGVGIKLEAGKQLLLNLHLFNTSDTELTGTSGSKILPVSQDAIVHPGEESNVVNLNLNILPNQDTTASAEYTVPEDTTLFAVLPHMHKLGTHAKVVVHSSLDGERTVHDAPYDFDNQLYYPFEAIKVAKGDKVTFDCTWTNTTSRTIHFGDSSNDEMCAMGLYRYPGF